MRRTSPWRAGGVVVVSVPLFWFLLLRWLWRHLVWGLLLRDLAGLELRLVATHPDGYGGLGFIGAYPNAFAAFVFAMTSVVAAEAVQAMLHGQLAHAGVPLRHGGVAVRRRGAVRLAAGGLQAAVEQLKQATLLACSAAATRSERASERQVLGRNIAAPADPGDEPTRPAANPPRRTLPSASSAPCR